MKAHFLNTITICVTLAFSQCVFATTYEIIKNANSELVANCNLLVKAKEGVTNTEFASKISSLGATVVHEYEYDNWYLVRFANEDADENLEDVLELDQVAAAHFDWVIFPNNYTPAEALFEDQWPLTSIGGSTVSTNVHEAWSLTRGSSNAGILILDSGWPNDDHADWDDTAGLLKLPATNAQGNPLNFASGTYGTPYEADEDELGHATAIGGIIAAEHDGVELCGISPHNYTISANIFFRWDHEGCERPAGLASDALLALEWLYQEWNSDPNYGLRGDLFLDEVDIVNASWSYYRQGEEGAYDALLSFITSQLAYGDNILFVTSAGHHESEGSPLLNFPAYSADESINIIAVNAFDRNGDWAEYSNYLYDEGPPINLVGAPGGTNGIYSVLEAWPCKNASNPDFTDEDDVIVDWHGEMSDYYDDGTGNPNDGNGYYGGASVATAHVTGIAALVHSLNPNIDVEDWRSLLISTALPGDEENGAGRVNALRAVLKTQGIKTLQYDLNIPVDVTIEDGLIIPEGITLTVEPGVNITMGYRSQIIVEQGGKLKLQGTTWEHIDISCEDTPNNFWKGIDSEEGQITLEWVDIRGVRGTWSETFHTIFARNSQPLGETYPVYISNCTIDGAGVVIWGTPEETTRMNETTIQNVSGTYSAGLYLYNCNVLFTQVFVLNCTVHNSYLKTISGSFYDCTFEGETTAYGVLCNVPTCNPNFYCCYFWYTASPYTYLGASLFSSYGCAPRVGAGSLNCYFRDDSHALIACEGTSPLPIISYAHNCFVQEGDHFFRWWDAPSTPSVYDVSEQCWDPSPPSIERFIPEDIDYWDFSSANPPNPGCISLQGSNSSDGGARNSLDDSFQDSLNHAIDLEVEGEYSMAQALYIELLNDSASKEIKLQALSRAIANQVHLDSSSWIPEVIDEFIQESDSTYDDVVIGLRLKTIHHLKNHDYEAAIEVCNVLLASDLSERDSLHVVIDLLSIQMSAGIVSPDGRLDNPRLNVPIEYTISAIAEGLSREQDLLSRIAFVGERDKSSLSGESPIAYALNQNYPNPFNPSTEIRFDLPEAIHAELKVFNILGQEVTTLVDDVRAAGAYRVLWDGKNAAGLTVASGVYIYQIKTPNFTDAKKMMLIR
ncbi:MAG: S8 family serine peptidase [bacterium]|nr:S8 family serine peptidase [bacterium]